MLLHYLCTGSCLGVPIYIVYVQGTAWVYLYILFMYRELPGCTYIYYLCTGSCLGVHIYIVYVKGTAWVYLYILFMYRELPRCTFIYCLCTGSCQGVPINIYVIYRELPGCTYKYICYVQGAAWVYLLLGSAGQSEGGYTGEDRVSASSGIASGTSSQPWMEDQVRINSKKYKD